MMRQVIRVFHSTLAQIFHIYCFYGFFMLFLVYYILRFDKCINLSLLFTSLLSQMLRHSLSGSDVLLFSEFINVVFIPFDNFIELIVLLHTFLVISFA